MKLIWASLALFCMAVCQPTYAESEGYETQILKIIKRVKNGELTDALTLVNKHLLKFPKSRIAHFIKGDILYAMANPLTAVGQSATLSSTVLTGLRKQIDYRWRHQYNQTDSTVPASLVHLGNHQHVMVADMASGRLYLYKNHHNRPVLIKDYYLTIGSAGIGKQIEGDNKTPVGVYFIYQHIDGRKLPDLYGGGAYPVNYPNRLDRANHRTGYGIWLHGTPSNTYARQPWASEGCFVLSNDDLADIEQYIDVANETPVILTEQVNWISYAQLKQARQGYLAVLEQWKTDWESLNTDKYLAHYSQTEFNFGQADYKDWANQKRAVNRNKKHIQIDLDIYSLFAYPGEKDMFVVHYQQNYRSNNYSNTTNKQQYWRKEADGRWRIVFEG